MGLVSVEIDADPYGFLAAHGRGYRHPRLSAYERFTPVVVQKRKSNTFGHASGICPGADFNIELQAGER